MNIKVLLWQFGNMAILRLELMENYYPLRQKIGIALAIILGALLLVCYQFKLGLQDYITWGVFFYSLFISLYLLVFDTLIDLNNNPIFLTWLGIALILFVFYIVTKDSTYFKINRQADFNIKEGINSYLSDNTSSALKTPLLFLIAYKALNELMKKLTGNFLINTYHQVSWKHDIVKRSITTLDVIFNVILFLVVIISALTR